ncbi:MraY family glycosyltransferase [Boseongicola aestuarii]|uniref:Putative undecaprenyl-phosphate N-acetylglucosaminyl 1-phosphate transferase n=1 Tax=Boseongicola aestuarii TaxID=1470561 RepID=A0A238IZZ2_9RHOB|nr:glycosyltransferase [Boseongicola aestuarii]SMX23621.1 putative undecaprenyl-phosphate N-acetylglucosaminyl 1-phosphate transferase [Boseongicola aestuarii]
MSNAFELSFVFLISFIVCGLIRLTRGWHIPLALSREDTKAVQAAHKVPTPRLGGVAFFAGLLASYFVISAEAHILFLAILSMLPLFLAGLAEDFGARISASGRMLAALISAALMIWNLNFWLPRLDLPVIDTLMMWAPFAIGVTLFCSAGVSNAFNLIDGVNGLSGYTGVLVALALSTIAFETGLVVAGEFALYIVAALMGFLVFNYPWGKVFLGDAGAYVLGHILCWLAIAMVVRVDELTPWAILLVFFWPVADTLLAISRRWGSGRSTGHPDRLHFHQLVMRALEICLFGRRARVYSNPLSTLILMPMIAAPVLTGVYFWDAPFAAFLATVFFGTLFAGTYRLGVSLARRRKKIWQAQKSRNLNAEALPE